jgi:flagellar motor switch protein FliM
MSHAPDNNFDRKKIQQLLANIGSKSADETTQIEAAEHDWYQPHYFSGGELKKLEDFAGETAATLAQKFADLFNSNFDATIASTAQHFAGGFLNQSSESDNDDYHLAFGIDQNHLCGVVSIPSQTATLLVTQLLGDSESEKDTDKALSQLEESFLMDIASSIIQIVSDSYDDRDFLPIAGIVKGQPPLELQDTEELCTIAFNIKKADSENNSEAKLSMLCETLDPIVGRSTQAAGGFSTEDISKAILDSLREMPVSVTAQLGSAMLTFEEVMSLGPGDVLLLDKAIDDPAELITEGRVLLRGQPAKSTGKYAMVITALADTR